MKSRPELLINVHDLLRQPGTRREVTRTILSPGFAITASEVPAGAEVQVDLVLESMAHSGTLRIAGVISAPWVGQCRRCLKEVEGELEIGVSEVFSRSPDTESDEEVWPLEEDEINIDEVVGENIFLSLPLAPLCGSDCRGPAPEKFPAVSAEEASKMADSEREKPPSDPRWAALDELRFD